MACANPAHLAVMYINLYGCTIYLNICASGFLPILYGKSATLCQLALHCLNVGMVGFFSGPDGVNGSGTSRHSR